MSVNYLTSTRATLFIGKDEDAVAYSCTEFNLPGISIGSIEVPTRFNPGKELDDRVSFEDLEVTFIVDEDLTNWKNIFDWMVSQGMPVGHHQYRKEKRKQDGSVQFYTSHNNIYASAKLYELMPVFLSGIVFTEGESETVVKTATARFTILYYEFA